MKTLRQKNSDIAIYYADFQRLITILHWDSHAKCAALREGLSTELKDALVFIEEKKDWEEFVVQLQNMDNPICTRAEESKGSKLCPSPSTTRTTYPAPTKSNDLSFCPGGVVPMALDSTSRISPEKQQRRMQEGLCAY